MIFHILNFFPLFFFREILITFTMILMLFIFFFFRKILITVSSLFSRFVFFILQNDFDNFNVLLFGVFLCVFDNIYFPFLYKEWKFTKKYFSIFFIRIFFVKMIFFLSVFPLSEFSSSQPFSSEFIISESEEISEISVSWIIYLGIFFSLTLYLHYSKNTSR